MAFEPEELAAKVLSNTLGLFTLETGHAIGKPWSDQDAISIYNFARVSHYSTWGNLAQIDVAGCDYRCAFCWVSNEALGGYKGNKDFLKRKKSELPGVLKNRDIVTSTELWSEWDKKVQRSRDGKAQDLKQISFSGGEPTLYRGAISNFAKEGAKRDYTTIIYTHGQKIADHPEYLDAFEGLQDHVKFSLSIKGVTPQRFQRVTGANAEHADKGFDALRELYARNFFTLPYAPMLNVLGAQYDDGEDDPIAAFHEKLSAIHPDLPRVIIYDKVTAGSVVHNPQEQAKKMQKAGLTGTKPFATGRRLEAHFADMGTPIIPVSHDNPRSQGEGAEIINQIRRDLKHHG